MLEKAFPLIFYPRLMAMDLQDLCAHLKSRAVFYFVLSSETLRGFCFSLSVGTVVLDGPFVFTVPQKQRTAEDGGPYKPLVFRFSMG